MGGVQSDDHVKQSVLIHLFSSHKTTYLSSHFPTSSSFFALKFSHFSSFLLSLSLFPFFYFDSAVFNSATAFNRTWCSPSWVGKISEADFSGSNGRMHCCATGKYYDDPDCKDCQIGQYADQMSLDTSCTTCARNSITPIPALPECSNCTIGKYSTAKRDECIICGAGFYQIDSIEESSCENCSKAKYQDVGGQYECKDCPAGWYQGQEAKPFCLPCIPVRDFFR